jgi:hypothetical protein
LLSCLVLLSSIMSCPAMSCLVLLSALSPVYTTLNFWYGTDKIGTRTTFLVLGLPI